jgi:pyridoxal phosphate enzyme (YggS family)
VGSHPAIRDRATLLANLEIVRARIERACGRIGRDSASVRLVAAAKAVEPERLRWAVEAGVTDIGENYVKELAAKRATLGGATWHFIGTLQSHTAHRVAELSDVVQTVTPGRAFSRLAARAVRSGSALPVLIEVDLTGGRSGLDPDGVVAFADEVATTEGVRLLGLMTVPEVPQAPEDARPSFRRLRELGERVVGRHPGAGELSMGMSLDYEVAIEEGATIVRIGTGLFGPRSPA